MTSAQLDAFHSEFTWPSRLLYVFLEDAYDGSRSKNAHYICFMISL